MRYRLAVAAYGFNADAGRRRARNVEIIGGDVLNIFRKIGLQLWFQASLCIRGRNGSRQRRNAGD